MKLCIVQCFGLSKWKTESLDFEMKRKQGVAVTSLSDFRVTKYCEFCQLEDGPDIVFLAPNSIAIYRYSDELHKK